MAAAHPRLRMWKVAMLGALLDSGRRDEARRIFESFVGARSLKLRDNQIFLPATCALAQAAAELGDTSRATVLQNALEPYANRQAVSGLGGISIGPVSRFAAMAARTSGDLDAAERLLRAAIDQTTGDRMRAYEARARADLAAVLTERGRPEDAHEAVAELQHARELATELGLVLHP
jgi:hypothetical protein